MSGIKTWTDDLDATRLNVEALHGVNRRRVRQLAASMLRAGGWQGPPVLLAVWEGTETFRRVLDGHHRIEAVKLIWRRHRDWAWEHLLYIPAICVDGEAVGEMPARLSELDEMIDYAHRA